MLILLNNLAYPLYKLLAAGVWNYYWHCDKFLEKSAVSEHSSACFEKSQVTYYKQ